MGRGRKPGDGRGRLGGRTKGTPNTETQLNRDMIQAFLDENAPEAWRAWHKIENPAQKVAQFIKLFEYVMPKYQSIEVKVDSETPDWQKKLEELRRK